MKLSHCRGASCKRDVVWAEVEKPDGTVAHVPLDPRAPVYMPVEGEDGRVTAKRVEGAMVSHFATCADANRFSGGGKR